ncbi:MAG: ribosome recycling factor [Puniceicoccales bacterium]|jgi:ribosome recycling factor|nr:ribosome recycling factor [Puniceicoccales bacterium]
MDEKQILAQLDDDLKKVVRHVETEFATIHAGKASPSLVDSLEVEIYGAKSRIRDISALTTPDARTIMIQPWDRGTAKAIEKAILVANLGFTPVVEADKIRCVLPEMSLERRREMVKRVAAMAEAGRVSARTARREALERAKALQKAGAFSEDDVKRLEKEVQKRTDGTIGTIGSAFEKKEKELLTH